VREVTLKRLESLYYAVTEASNGHEAIERLGSAEPIALVLCDIVMPGGMSGYDVARAAAKLKPGVKFLLTSGYDGLARQDQPGTPGSMTVLHKPYSRAELARAISKALAG
jgi:two-component system CheB/CheR fusion protein